MLWYIIAEDSGNGSAMCDSKYGGLLVFDSYADALKAIERMSQPGSYYPKRIVDYPNFYWKSEKR